MPLPVIRVEEHRGEQEDWEDAFQGNGDFSPEVLLAEKEAGFVFVPVQFIYELFCFLCLFLLTNKQITKLVNRFFFHGFFLDIDVVNPFSSLR